MWAARQIWESSRLVDKKSFPTAYKECSALYHCAQNVLCFIFIVLYLGCFYERWEEPTSIDGIGGKFSQYW